MIFPGPALQLGHKARPVVTGLGTAVLVIVEEPTREFIIPRRMKKLASVLQASPLGRVRGGLPQPAPVSSMHTLTRSELDKLTHRGLSRRPKRKRC